MVRTLIDQGRLPRGIRFGKRVWMWPADDVPHMRWILANERRFRAAKVAKIDGGPGEKVQKQKAHLE